MNLSLLLFLIGIFGFVLNRKNIILMLISIEIMLLAITFLILINSLNFDDILGQVYAIYIIAIAGAESAIGLGILVAFYRFIPSKILYCKSYGHYTSFLPCVPRVNYGTKGVRNYSTYLSKNSSLDPFYMTGLIV
jgi:NADH-ubiquinone oxidoreductase chain 4L